MTHTTHKRVKMGMLPGDIPKRTKIAMLERPQSTTGLRFGPGCVQEINPKAKKAFKKILRARERARMKERQQRTEMP